MSRLQSGRYKSADEWQTSFRIWLEGAKKRDEALAIVMETEHLAEQSTLLKEESEALLMKASEGLKQLPGWVGEDLKGPHWAVEHQGLSKERESQRIDLDIEHFHHKHCPTKPIGKKAMKRWSTDILKAHQEAEVARAHTLMDQNENCFVIMLCPLQGTNPFATPCSFIIWKGMVL